MVGNDVTNEWNGDGTAHRRAGYDKRQRESPRFIVSLHDHARKHHRRGQRTQHRLKEHDAKEQAKTSVHHADGQVAQRHGSKSNRSGHTWAEPVGQASCDGNKEYADKGHRPNQRELRTGPAKFLEQLRCKQAHHIMIER